MFTKKPIITEIILKNHYDFMYENFVIATQFDAYLLLKKNNQFVDVLKFDSTVIKYGSPNDEGRDAHPLTKYGDFIYGFYEVKNSPWITEQMIGNRSHSQHEDSMFSNLKHYLVCFKDVMFEVTCESYKEIKMSVQEINSLVEQQMNNLND